MQALIVYATKHGSTKEIAERIASRLRRRGIEVRCEPVAATSHLGLPGAVVIGSAVYYGSWRQEAVEFVRRNETALSERAVWLFSSGPVGTTDEPVPEVDHSPPPTEVPRLALAVTAREHRTFAGRLRHEGLSLIEQFAAQAGKAVEGDYRDWPNIDAWADEIAAALKAPPRPAIAGEPSTADRPGSPARSSG